MNESETALPDGEGGLARIRLDLGYDGTDFSGWATQPGRRTVQGVLEEALARICRASAVPLTVAGRTDAGVHASGQVAHADMDASTWSDLEQGIVRRLAAVLPPDVRIYRAARVSDAFDARFAALWRRYEYRICDAEAGADPLRRRYVLTWRRSLDAEAMARAAAGLCGEHDFAAFCRYREGATAIRRIIALDVLRAGDDIACTVQADAFCHSMVRSLVGALIAVGDRRRPEDWPAQLLTRSTRAGEVVVAPPHGLTLVAVGYPPDAELAARSEQTRRVRSIDG